MEREGLNMEAKAFGDNKIVTGAHQKSKKDGDRVETATTQGADGKRVKTTTTQSAFCSRCLYFVRLFAASSAFGH